MIEDKELDLYESNKLEINPNIQTQFSQNMDIVKENILKTSAVEDKEFIETIKDNVKEAAVKLTEVEKDKANYQQQEVQYKSELLDTEQLKNVHVQKEDKWDNKQKRRQFHYEGVKPIMEFVGITQPMNLFFLYLLSALLLPLFILAKLIRGSFGTLIAGAIDSNRPKTAKGFLWTIICIFAVFTLVCLVYLFLKWQGIDILANIKN